MNEPKSEQASPVPSTVAELIAVLSQYSSGSRLSFAPFNLSRVSENDDIVRFEIREIEGVDFTMSANPDG